MTKAKCVVMEQGNLTLFWDEVTRALEVSMPDADPRHIPAVHGALRAGDMVAWAIWANQKMSGVIVCGFVHNMSDERAASVYAIHSEAGLTDEQWQEADASLAAQLKALGVKEIHAYTNDSSGPLCKMLGWRKRPMYIRDLQ